MKIYWNMKRLQPVFEEHGAFLSGELGDGHASHIESLVAVSLDQAKDVCVICDPQVAADLVLLDILGADDDHDLRLVAQFF